MTGITVQGPADVNQPPLCQELYVPCLSPKSAPDFGLVVSAVDYLTKSLGVVAEASVYANQWESFGTNCFPAGGRVPRECPVHDTNHVRSIVAGLRGRTSVWEDPFGVRYCVLIQGLIGPQWSSIGSTRLAIQPGIGAEAFLHTGVTLQFEYDYRWAPDDRRDLSTGRALVAIVFPVGSRE
jgi:hypothetical protein